MKRVEYEMWGYDGGVSGLCNGLRQACEMRYLSMGGSG